MVHAPSLGAGRDGGPGRPGWARRLPSPRHPGLDRFFQEASWLWAAIFAASPAGLAAALAIAPASMILLLSTVVTIGGAAAGAFLCILWFIRVLRRFGLHVRFTQA